MKKYIYVALAGLVAACSPAPQEEEKTEETGEQTQMEEPTEPSDASSENMYIVEASGETMTDIAFNIQEMRVPANTEITIKLVNKSASAAMSHNFVIIEPGTANEVGQNGLKHPDNGNVMPNDLNVIAHSPLAAPGTTVEFTFTTPEKGDYEFICSFPGHWGIMKGVFIVE